MNFVLNFHGIGAASRPMELGEDPYWISEAQFSACLDLVEAAGNPIDITFDDGNESDHSIALPALEDRGMSATFYVLAGKLDQTGYLTTSQVGAIAATDGMRVGSHGMDHQSWPELDDSELDRELRQSKALLEQAIGSPIVDAGLPFGRYDGRILRRLREAGYANIFSSDGGQKLTARNPVPRFSVRSDTDLAELAKLMAGGSLMNRLRNELRSSIKALR